MLKWWLVATLAPAVLELSIDGEAVLLRPMRRTSTQKSHRSRTGCHGEGSLSPDGACVRRHRGSATGDARAGTRCPSRTCAPSPTSGARCKSGRTRQNFIASRAGHRRTSPGREPRRRRLFVDGSASTSASRQSPAGDARWRYARRSPTRKKTVDPAVAPRREPLHGHLIEEAEYTLEAWIFHPELGGTNVSRRPFVCVRRVGNSDTRGASLDCDRMFQIDGPRALRQAERDGGTKFRDSDAANSNRGCK